MKILHLYRSNITNLEYYHKFKDLETFEINCHDFYLLQLIWILRNTDIDETIVWRLSKKPLKDIIFKINGKRFIQRWVRDLQEVFKYPKPNISFFRGGFKEYSNIVKRDPSFFKTSLYLGASKRLFPAFGDKYDIILLESELDFKNNYICKSFYKTCNSNIFYPIENSLPSIDILWIHNLSQIRYKGAEFFLDKISKSGFLRNLNIVHVGNKSDVLNKLCKRYRVTNIKSVGWIERPELNKILNKSKFGLITSNNIDGCPRISTEILCSGTPLLIREQTRLLSYYKNGVVRFKDKNINKIIKKAFNEYNKHKKNVFKAIENDLTIDKICRKNWNLWNQK